MKKAKIILSYGASRKSHRADPSKNEVNLSWVRLFNEGDPSSFDEEEPGDVNFHRRKFTKTRLYINKAMIRCLGYS